MNAWRWIRRSLWFHRRAHLGTALGTCSAAAAIAGAMLAGDAASKSLTNLAAVRLGKIEIAAQTGRRPVRQAIAEDLARRTGGHFSPVLVVRATAASTSGQPIAIQLIGVDQGFWRLAGARGAPALREDGAWPNARAAKRIGVRPGDWITIRAVPDAGMAAEAPLAPSSPGAVPTRIAVSGIVSRDAMGEFSLDHNAMPPENVFVPLKWLQKHFALPGRVNLILGRSSDATAANTALEDAWKLEDAGLELQSIEATGELELRSHEVFVPPAIAESVLREMPQAREVLTYVVNEIASADRSAPYAVVAALPPHPEGPIPPSSGPGSIVLNEWLGHDLGASVGGAIKMRYYAPGDGKRLEERTAAFNVAGIVPIKGRAHDPKLMPDFPGLAAAKDCRSWDPGFDIDLSKIRDKDEAYWDQYRGTPKAFISLKDGQALWGSRFGKSTAIRFEKSDPDTLRRALAKTVGPGAIGIGFRDARTDALRAAKGSVNFGGLFMGFNVFLIISALLLTALLFAFNVEGRRPELGALLALGWPRARVRRLVLAESILLAVLGTLPGILLGIAYMAVAIMALNTIWISTMDAAPLSFHVSPSAAMAGAFIGILLSSATIAWASRGLLRGPIRALLAGEYHDAAAMRTGWPRTWIATSLMALVLAAVVLMAPGSGDGENRAMRFFGAGSALLMAAVAMAGAWLRRPTIASQAQIAGIGKWQLAWLGIRRRSGRSTATIALLASGIFMVASAGAHRRDPLANADRRDSGTGGFSLLAEGPMALGRDPRDPGALQSLGVSDEIAGRLRVVPGRVRDGDDASCLNPTKAQAPRLLGVDTEELKSRAAFRITKSPQHTKVRGWELLDAPLGGNVVPVIADESTAVWSLGLGVGDRLSMADGQGRAFDVQIVGLMSPCILQGWLVMSDRNFLARYPDTSGYRMLLVDGPSDSRDASQKELGRALADLGWQVRPTVARLADLMAVEHTYLAIFQIAGGLGVLLGTAGLGAVLLRNIQERRRELAMLRAIGFSADAVTRLVRDEHILLLVVGLACGIAPALLASWPAIAASGAQLPIFGLVATLAGVIAVGLFAVSLATRRALAGNLIAALRNE